MDKINPDTKSAFFPNSPSSQRVKATRGQISALDRNDDLKAVEIKERTGKDAQVQIDNKVRDFARIKKSVDAAPAVDNTDKIANLKSQIQNGTYQIDYEALADKLLTKEF